MGAVSEGVEWMHARHHRPSSLTREEPSTVAAFPLFAAAVTKKKQWNR